jgi:hypothetical protein
LNLDLKEFMNAMLLLGFSVDRNDAVKILRDKTENATNIGYDCFFQVMTERILARDPFGMSTLL